LTLKYTSELAFNRFMGMDVEVPMLVEGSSPSKEHVGTGDGATLVYYLDQKYPIKDSVTLYTGSIAESGATTTLTLGTHYALDYDKSKITLTSPGVISSNALFAEYFYHKAGVKNTLVTEVLERAEAELDEAVNTVFVDSTTSSPSYSAVTDEVHPGQGFYGRVYQLDLYPLCHAQTTVSGAISVGATTIDVSGSTDGFPYSGVLGIGTNKVLYTGKTSTSFTGITGVDTSISSGTVVYPWVIERSLTTQGTEPTWEVLSCGSDYDVDWESGTVKLNSNTVIGGVIYDQFTPPEQTWNRLRASYSYGIGVIPKDVVRCVHLIAAKELYSGQVLNALSRGTNGFTSGALDNADMWIKQTLEKYKCWRVSNFNNK